jgi:hypothetical protein
MDPAPWENDPIVMPAPGTTRAALPPLPAGMTVDPAPWQNDPIVTPAGSRDELVMPAVRAPRAAQSLTDAIQAGWQGSATGLALRRRLPSIVLDPNHTTWYQNLAGTATRMIAEAPEMIAGAAGGAAVGGVAGSEVPIIGNVVGGVVGGGAGAFALPTAIRTALMERYSKGEVHSAADFLNRTSIVLQPTAKDALVGALTAGAGKAAQLGMGTAGIGAKLATGAAEYGTMTVAPPLLDGKLPEPQDFTNAAILMVGLHAAGYAAGTLREVYAKTGIEPMRVAMEARVDPTILEDIKAGMPAPEVAKDVMESAPASRL